jgi:hypothetical protein
MSDGACCDGVFYCENSQYQNVHWGVCDGVRMHIIDE